MIDKAKILKDFIDFIHIQDILQNDDNDLLRIILERAAEIRKEISDD